MDRLDRKILDFMQTRGRASYAEAGAAVGLSVSAVAERLKRLESQGTIRGWTARLDPEAVGMGILAFVFVSVEGSANEAAFVAATKSRPEVLECHHVTGDWSYLLKVRVFGMAALETLISSAIKEKAGVTRTHTMIALSSAKETAALPLTVESIVSTEPRR